MRLFPQDKDVWSHHPNCKNFAKHVYLIKGYRICRGCFNFYSGLLIGGILIGVLFIWIDFTTWLLFALTLITFLPTPLAIFLEPYRVVKDVVRLILGISTSTMVYTVILGVIMIFTDEFRVYRIILPFISIFGFFFFLNLFVPMRHKKNNQICLECKMESCEVLNKKKTK